MFDSGHPLVQIGYTLLASVAGAVTALSFRPWEGMSGRAIGMSLFVGASFSIFVTPWIVRGAFGTSDIDPRLAGGIYYLMATGSNILIPLVIKRFSGLIGNGDINGAGQEEK